MTVTESPRTLTEGSPLAGLKIIDCDTHYSEPYDLWTSRAPAKYRDQVPIVRHAPDGRLSWYLKDRLLFKAGGSSFVTRKGDKIPFFEEDLTSFEGWGKIHEASYDAVERVNLMDEIGVHAQIVYPNTMGFAMGSLVQEEDKALALATVQVYNDAMSEWAAQVPGRLFPQAVMPVWDIELCAQEAYRAKHELGLTGVIMSGEPHTAGLPDLGTTAWDPFYEVVSDLRLPVNIHIGVRAIEGLMATFLGTAWPSLDDRARKPVNSVQMELANSRFVSNLVLSDLAFRWPDVKWVSVESGIGWIPYVLERIDYEYLEDFPTAPAPDRPTAREMFQKNCFGTFWFEDVGPTLLLDYIGADNVMWETDFPHPTCLHPDAVTRSAEKLKTVDRDTLRKVFQDNAAGLYGIAV